MNEPNTFFIYLHHFCALPLALLSIGFAFYVYDKIKERNGILAAILSSFLSMVIMCYFQLLVMSYGYEFAGVSKGNSVIQYGPWGFLVSMVYIIILWNLLLIRKKK